MGEFERKLAHVEAAKRECDVLKDVPARGPEGQKRLRTLKNAGKEFRFHEVMMNALPAVFTKELNKRHTFDGLTVRQLDVEIGRKTQEVYVAVQESEKLAAERVAAVHDAREALADAKALQLEHSRAVAEAAEAVTDAKKEAQAARQHVRAVEANLKRTMRNLQSATQRLSVFRSGPLATY